MTSGERIRSALESIPRGEFLLTASDGSRSNGVLVDFVGQCANDPPMLVVATAKGQVLTPIIRDSRAFTVSLITDANRPIARRFAKSSVEIEDPFIGLPTEETGRGIPVLARTAAWFECELIRHLDIDADCELYVGNVSDVMITEEAQSELQSLIPETHPMHRAPRSTARPRVNKGSRGRTLVAESS